MARSGVNTSADSTGLSVSGEVGDLRLPVFEHDGTREAANQFGVEGSKAGSNSVPGSTLFLLGEGLPPIPAKLVAKIQKCKFVDMAELLRNNIEAERRHTKEGGSGAVTGQSSQNRREVPYILSWILCFGMYAYVVVN